MEITIIHGQGHKGSTYQISKMIAQQLTTENTIIYEFFMPLHTPPYCVGCYKCIYHGEEHCPHADKVQPIVKAIEKSKLIIVDSPTYCFEMTGQLKTFFDHLAYMWMSHRPNKTMFSKVGIVVSTAAGAGSKKVVKALSQQLFWLGIAKTYRMAKNVNASSWAEVSDKTKQEIATSIDRIVAKARHKLHTPTPNIKTKFIFKIMTQMQKGNNWNITDKKYWEKNLWFEKSRPWR
jgi:multimeric flavodoxin WrbA